MALTMAKATPRLTALSTPRPPPVAGRPAAACRRPASPSGRAAPTMAATIGHELGHDRDDQRPEHHPGSRGPRLVHLLAEEDRAAVAVVGVDRAGRGQADRRPRAWDQAPRRPASPDAGATSTVRCGWRKPSAVITPSAASSTSRKAPVILALSRMLSIDDHRGRPRCRPAPPARAAGRDHHAQIVRQAQRRHRLAEAAAEQVQPQRHEAPRPARCVRPIIEYSPPVSGKADDSSA